MRLAAMQLTEHQLLIFWVQLLVLVAVARGLGGLLRRMGQPAVVGELAAGLLIGPSILGRVLPGVHSWLFPDDPLQGGLLLAVAWIGVALLLVVTGFETDLKLLRNLGRSSMSVATGSLVVPLVLGFGLGLALPGLFIGLEGDRATFAMFMAVALAISALPVIAKILIDMGLMRRNVGQVIVASAMANDLIGWILLGVIAGIVTGGGLDLVRLGTAIAGVALFFAAALTLGQRLTDAALRRAWQGANGAGAGFTVVVLATLAAGALTQAIGVEAVLGAFVAGIVLGRSRYQRPEVTRALGIVVTAFLAPLFFATAGLAVDLGLLLDPTVAFWAVIVLAVASFAKVAGSYAGARVGRMRRREGVAVGIGLNARGALEIVVATVGLSLGVLNDASYTIIVVMALVTSMMAPPLLRRVLAGLPADPVEAERLRLEEVLGASVIAGVRTALLPTRGGENSILAARVLDLSMQADTAITTCLVHPDGDDDARQRGEATAREVAQWLRSRELNRIVRTSQDAAADICAEARLGYGIVALGMSERFRGGHGLSPVLQSILVRCPVPMLLVKRGENVDLDAEPLPFRRILVPATGTLHGQAAEEIAYTLAGRLDAAVDVVHVARRLKGGVRESASVTGVIDRARSLASKYGREATISVRAGSLVGPELAQAATEAGSDIIVLSARVRSYNAQPFLGHGVEWLLEYATQTVLAVVFPNETPEG